VTLLSKSTPRNTIRLWLKIPAPFCYHKGTWQVGTRFPGTGTFARAKGSGTVYVHCHGYSFKTVFSGTLIY
jgi:hypothetical protein